MTKAAENEPGLSRPQFRSGGVDPKEPVTKVNPCLENGVTLFYCPFCNDAPSRTERKIRKHLRQCHKDRKVIVSSRLVKEDVSDLFGDGFRSKVAPVGSVLNPLDLRVADHQPPKIESKTTNQMPSASVTVDSGAVSGKRKLPEPLSPAKRQMTLLKPTTRFPDLTSSTTTKPAEKNLSEETVKSGTVDRHALKPADAGVSIRIDQPVDTATDAQSGNGSGEEEDPLQEYEVAVHHEPETVIVEEDPSSPVVEDDADNDHEPDQLIIFEEDKHSFCGVCSQVLEFSPDMKDVTSQHIQGESYVRIIQSVLGEELLLPFLCQACEALTQVIGKFKVDLLKLEEKLESAESKLRDLFQSGRDSMEADLETGGSLNGPAVLHLVEEGDAPSRLLTHLGYNVMTSYHGNLIGDNTSLVDDCSEPQVWSGDHRDTHLYLGMQEWASSGLTVVKGSVQIPNNVIHGCAIGQSKPRMLLSTGLCHSLCREAFFCLDCNFRSDRLGDLLQHSEQHQVEESSLILIPSFDASPHPNSLDIAVDPEAVFLTDENEEAVETKYKPPRPESKVSKKQDRSQHRFESGKGVRSDMKLTEDDKKSQEFKAFAHREQFKEFRDDVPTLDKPFQCDECGKTFAGAHELWGHQSSFGNQTFNCNFKDCTDQFLRLADFAVHYAAHGGQRLEIPASLNEKKVLNITCPVCRTLISGLYKLQRHKMKHDSELKYKCPACPKQFVKANTLRNHIKNVHKGGNESRSCKICKKGQYNEQGMIAHMKSTHGDQETKMVCMQCEEVFSSVAALIEHIGSHEVGDRSCAKCGEIFLRQADQRRHSMALAKTGSCPIKPINKPGKVFCPECDLQLDDGQTISQHLGEAHGESRPRFQCSECGLKVVSLEGCRNHYRRVHKDRPHSCFYCKESYVSESGLHEHIATSHQDVLGHPPSEGQVVQCRFCSLYKFTNYMEMVSHVRYSHLVESVDIANTDLEEVTMIGGHVVEFGVAGDQIIALHTMP